MENCSLHDAYIAVSPAGPLLPLPLRLLGLQRATLRGGAADALCSMVGYVPLQWRGGGEGAARAGRVAGGSQACHLPATPQNRAPPVLHTRPHPFASCCASSPPPNHRSRRAAGCALHELDASLAPLEALLPLLLALEGAAGLHSLALSGQASMTDDYMPALAHLGGSLRRLDLSGCPVSAAGG